VTGYQGATPPGAWGSNSSATGMVTTTSNVIVPGNVSGCGGLATTTSDAAGNVHTNCIDGLGRLGAVLEPNGMLTSYTYDLLDNLAGVSAQCLSGYTCSPVGSTGQTRTFTYTTLSRLQSATNPESNTVSYTYYNNGNLYQRTDANGTVATMTYDAVNRPTGISYTTASPAVATPSVSYAYDKNSVGTGFTGFVGALTSVSSSAGKMEYSYDGFGRIVASRQTTNGTPYTFSNYQYSLTDQLTGITYPSGRAITYGLDLADQTTSVKGTPSGGSTTTYATGITYTAAGTLSSLPFNNGITESHTWNSLFEHTGIQAGSLLSLNYSYCPGGQATCYCPSGQPTCSTSNTGSPFQQTISIGGQTMATQEYAHTDPLNRVTTVSERTGGTSFTPTCPDSSSVWCRQFSYDNSGNLTVASRSPAGSNSWDVASFSAKNQALPTSSWGYDLAGNLTQAPGVTIQYDAENRQVAYGATTYVYDGLGNRVEKIDSSNNVTTYVYDAFGNLAAEYGGSATITPGTQYVTADALGSTRLVMTGASASERHDFQPFGLEDFGDSGTWRAGVAGYNVDTVRQKFTGQERDNESYLDFFQARYFSGIQGRFTSPDPGNAGADPSDPQSWNGYAYVSGNPLAFTDPSGEIGEATTIGTGIAPGIGTVIGAAVDLGMALYGIFGGGGCHTDLSKVSWTPNPIQIPGLVFYAQATAQAPSKDPCPLSARDRRYLDLYYKPVSQNAAQYKVDPALVLGMGIEGSFADPDPKLNTMYQKTGDVFGQTGGSTANPTKATDPTDNANGWFKNWGKQVQGVGSNVGTFLNGLQGTDAAGRPVKGWKTYNSKYPATWHTMAVNGIASMLRELPIYLKNCLK
jgi:RHS repeat-associated protein